MTLPRGGTGKAAATAKSFNIDEVSQINRNTQLQLIHQIRGKDAQYLVSHIDHLNPHKWRFNEGFQRINKIYGRFFFPHSAVQVWPFFSHPLGQNLIQGTKWATSGLLDRGLGWGNWMQRDSIGNASNLMQGLSEGDRINLPKEDMNENQYTIHTSFHSCPDAKKEKILINGWSVSTGQHCVTQITLHWLLRDVLLWLVELCWPAVHQLLCCKL